VVIPAYNAAETISIAIESALNLVGPRVVVVDDGSRDGTAEIAQRFGVEVIRQMNAGVSAARATGLERVSSDFVIFLDSDDRLLATWESALAVMRNQPSVAVVAGAVMRFGSARNRIVVSSLKAENSESLLKRPYAPWPISAALWRVSSVRDAQNLSVPALNHRYADDYELLIRCSLVGAVVTVPEPFAMYAISGGKSTKDSLSAVRGSERVRRHYATALGVPAIEPLRPIDVKRAARWRQLIGNYYESGTLNIIRDVILSPIMWAPLVNRAMSGIREHVATDRMREL
jgi:glycosyltransferase involved in cell wall biosynthesis